MKEITLRIIGARYTDGELHITCSSVDGIRAVHAIEKDKAYDLIPHKEKRSLTANSYAWALINKISEKIHEPPTVIYRWYVRDIGSKRSITHVPVEDVDAEVKAFTANHIGRLVSVGDSNLPGYAMVIKIYGSSSFDTRQMSAFIDYIVQDAQALGIETKEQEDIDSLLDSWEART